MAVQFVFPKSHLVVGVITRTHQLQVVSSTGLRPIRPSLPAAHRYQSGRNFLGLQLLVRMLEHGFDYEIAL